jgi:hypothetical protein
MVLPIESIPGAPPGHLFLSRWAKVNYWKVGQELLSGTAFRKALSNGDIVPNFWRKLNVVERNLNAIRTQSERNLNAI